MEKGPDWGGAAPHPRLALDHLLGLGTTGRGMLSQVSLQAGGVLAQRAGLPTIAVLFETPQAFLRIGAQIAHQGRFAQMANAPDEVVGQIKAFQIQRLHFALNFRVRVGVTFGFQRVDLGLGKF